MLDQILSSTVLTLLGILITSSVGYLAGKVRFYRKRVLEKENNETIQNEAIKFILQKQLTDIFYKYEEKQAIPDLDKRIFVNLYKSYKKLGGNDFVQELVEMMKTWDIVKTDILKQE